MASLPAELGRRERQIVETVYRLGRATVAQVLAELPDPPSYSAVQRDAQPARRRRGTFAAQDGLRYVYLPVIAPGRCQPISHGARGPHFFRRISRRSGDRPLRPAGSQASREELEHLSQLDPSGDERGEIAMPAIVVDLLVRVVSCAPWPGFA